MAGRQPASTARARGSITTLPSGTIRVRVYAGIDPVSGRRHYLTELVQPGKKAQREAEAVRARLLAQVEERRNPRTNATVDELVRRHLDQFAGAPNTLQMYRGHVKNHISPLLGRINIGRLDPEILDSFYAELRRCRIHCSGSGLVDHRTRRDHECDGRCRPHRCKPLSATTIRHIHFILSGAYKRAVRWRWVAVNPLAQAEPPPAPKSNPRPPSAEQAAQLLNKAWDDPDWGALIWTAMTTGARRGELCAVRWTWLNFEEGRETLWLQSGIRKSDDGWVEGDLKTHQQRRIALDAETVAVLTDLRTRAVKRAEMLGIELAPDAFVFSTAADGATFPTPDSVTQRYDRMAKKLGIVTTFHKLRHYSATELIVGGVDPRTVAGRLGHGDGGTTTLKTYTAWVSEADQRAATGLSARMPERPSRAEEAQRAVRVSVHPYEHLAHALITKIAAGELAVGDSLPPVDQLAVEGGVSLSTARRSVRLLKDRGIVASVRNRPTVTAVGLLDLSAYCDRANINPSTTVAQEGLQQGIAIEENRWVAVLRGPNGLRSTARVIDGSLGDSSGFRRHLISIARIEDPCGTDSGESWIGEYELEIRPLRGGEVVSLRW
ncbi:tyrosine-type recombinase/integrase [Pseudonocardia sp. DR1-2]|uniref:tyrosine-type recombinase/integrase n=1 Tax=Pseudonocardia sp. DR1-2 TaxID=2951168 RepID=UPI002042CC6E|nr:tyrosine-type recombinase/integrase [Pseudonocardia sp. DR1-2]MCM3846344.1 tyrosine-type recombinase/integrase [Pseudonocardia sp. DR1-2]